MPISVVLSCFYGPGCPIHLHKRQSYTLQPFILPVLFGSFQHPWRFNRPNHKECPQIQYLALFGCASTSDFSSPVRVFFSFMTPSTRTSFVRVSFNSSLTLPVRCHRTNANTERPTTSRSSSTIGMMNRSSLVYVSSISSWSAARARSEILMVNSRNVEKSES